MVLLTRSFELLQYMAQIFPRTHEQRLTSQIQIMTNITPYLSKIGHLYLRLHLEIVTNIRLLLQ